MSTTPVGAAAPSGLAGELRSTARGGALSLAGSLFGTAMGFVLVLVLARQLGPSGSGLVLQAMGVFMICLSLARLGTDTTAVWLVPRLRHEQPDQVRAACVLLLGLAGSTGLVLWIGWLLVRPALSGHGIDVVDSGALGAVLGGVPLAAVMLAALAATRAFGGVVPYTLVGNVGVPLARPVAVLAGTLAGGAVVTAGVAWTAPLVPGVIAAVWVLHRQVTRFERQHGLPVVRVADRALRRRAVGFALPRTLSAALEESLVWLDVVLVGLIAGPAAAGVYGAATRFVSAGSALLQAMRIVVAPRFSAMLARGRRQDVQDLYDVTGTWIVLAGAPVYVLLAAHAGTVLDLLGPGFDRGTSAVVALCVGGVGMLVGGNVQSLLLMSGHSGWAAANKGVVLAVNVAANLALIAPLGITGAAISWAACAWLDTVLAVLQVRRFTGVRLAVRSLARCLLAVLGCAAAVSWLVRAQVGEGVGALLLSVVLTALAVGGYAAADRRRLHTAELAALLPRRSSYSGTHVRR
ncbi:oligosaccharide flippase family protein [Nocardioides sp. dk4132]|uniref:oligosaccharide flippase family protein n=1 Tax=unclassified Nocardioides TaxID=2615069 RepID=UPI001295DE7B|nr:MULTISPECIES: polysaccharide biosynthesis C-terminal domain-containing protein [unclassified Nocardioides]MQW74772.1 oligosaccharide flippase family protein [Nocardioides sp. dk4132]QGA06669.1 oligosaccharide flippase family protein [Nocardioides sp. dk884]